MSKTKLNIFLDDDRPLPEGFDLLFRSGRSLLKYLRENKGAEFGIISFDHDLGVVMDGYDVVNYSPHAHSAHYPHPHLRGGGF